MRGLLGRLNWATREGMPHGSGDCSMLASKMPTPKVKDSRDCNYVLYGWLQVDLPIVIRPIPFEDLRIVLFTDASLGNHVDGGTQLSYICCTTHSKLANGQEAQVNVLAYKSHRMTRSGSNVLFTESNALSEGLALAESIRSPNGVPFFEISSKTNTNVDDMFHHMYEMVLKLRPCNCFKHVNWQPKLHVQCHKIQKTILKLILMKNARSFNGGARMPNAVILYIFSFLGVAMYEVQWYGIAIEESKKSTTNYRQQVNNTRNKMTCVVM